MDLFFAYELVGWGAGSDRDLTRAGKTENTLDGTCVQERNLK